MSIRLPDMVWLEATEAEPQPQIGGLLDGSAMRAGAPAKPASFDGHALAGVRLRVPHLQKA